MPGGQHAPELTDPEEIELWNTLVSNQGKTFTEMGNAI